MNRCRQVGKEQGRYYAVYGNEFDSQGFVSPLRGFVRGPDDRRGASVYVRPLGTSLYEAQASVAWFAKQPLEQAEAGERQHEARRHADQVRNKRRHSKNPPDGEAASDHRDDIGRVYGKRCDVSSHVSKSSGLSRQTAKTSFAR